MSWRDTDITRERRRNTGAALPPMVGFMLILAALALVTDGDALSDFLFWLDGKLGGLLPYVLVGGFWLLLAAILLCANVAGARDDRLAREALDARRRGADERAAADSLRVQSNVVGLPQRPPAEVINFPAVGALPAHRDPRLAPSGRGVPLPKTSPSVRTVLAEGSSIEVPPTGSRGA